ncbi:MAG: GNAT family N-acetyltransferase [Chloroflexi bacterium]|nr:GNAT family N-acetyltransferase [Chloroflexota bacterium]
MTQPDIRIEHIKIKDLVEFAEGAIGSAHEGQFVPITMQRAIAHAHNTYAAKDDVALLAAIDSDNEVVGYFGILPLLLRKGDELVKVHWFTTWSVSSKVRGLGVGSRLMQEALTLDKDYLIIGSLHARRVCQKYGFWERQPLTYYWLDTTGMGRLNLLTGVLRLFRKMLPILRVDKPVEIVNAATKSINRIFSPLTKKIFYALLTKAQAGILDGFRFREVPQIHAKPPHPARRPEIELHRGVEAINWMLSHPWVVETGQSVTEKMDYYFSDARPLYRLIALEVYTPEDEYKGFVVFSVSQKGSGVALKTLDFRFTSPSDSCCVLALAIKYGRQYQAETIEIPAEVAAHLKDSLLGKLLLHEKKRIYQCMPKADDSPLAQAWQDITLHLYDGDMAFS